MFPADEGSGTLLFSALLQEVSAIPHGAARPACTGPMAGPEGSHAADEGISMLSRRDGEHTHGA